MVPCTRSAGRSAGDPLEHPAALAWSSIHPRCGRPTAITVLKSCLKSGVYRLHDVLPDRSAVIAKLARRETVAVERAIYEVVLPSLSSSRIACFGAVDEAPAGDMTWLFTQDAGDRRVEPEQHVLLATYLARLHTAAVDSEVVRAAGLPDRGLDFYRRSVEQSRRRLRALIAEWAEPARGVYAQNLALLDELAAQWATFARLAGVMPTTLAHCDLNRQNVRIGERSGEPVVYVLDWEMAGWGSPASDLGNLTTRFKVGAAALDAYASVAGRRWPWLDAGAIEQARRVGVVMRAIYWIAWELACLGPDVDERSLERFGYYAERLRSALGPCEGLGLLREP